MESITKKTIKVADAMALNRHQRRALAKANGYKNIPGSNTDHLKMEIICKMTEKGMPKSIIDFYIKNNRMPENEKELEPYLEPYAKN